MVFSVAILGGSMWLQHQIWPPKPPVGPIAKHLNLAFNRMPTGDVLVDMSRLGVDIELLYPSGPRKIEPTPTVKPPREVAPLAWLISPPSPSNLGLFGVLVREFLQRPNPARKVELAQTYPIGNEKSFIRALLTTRGAGVQQLTLNEFETANWLGEPVKAPLELIPTDPEIPSFLMYHYRTPRKPEDHPASTLGDKIWQYEETKTDQDGTQKVRFSTTLAEEGMEHIHITKTYLLGPKDYHITLLLEFENKAPNGAETALRYQLTGPHGLPIEGEWYTNTYRNAVIGMLDKRKYLSRTLEDSFYVSRNGGSRVPEDERGESLLEYAGITTQYFASLIVLDDRQPERAQGGVDRKNILAWGRPTLESREKRGQLVTVKGDRLIVKDADGGTIYHALPRVLKHIEDAKIGDGMDVVVNYAVNGPTKEPIATWIRRAATLRPYLDDITVRVNSEVVELKPSHQRVAHQFMLYNGPVKTALLGQFRGDKAVDPDLVTRYTDTLHLDTLTDYRSAGWPGAFSQAIHFTELLILVTRFMHWLLNLLHLIVGNYGLTIILLTVIVRGLMFPISKRQAYFSIRMQELAPELKKLQEKFKNDPRGKTEATMELYRKHKVHPLGSCLPLVLQLPIFLGLYYALQESIHFRLAPFLWIKNLAAPDMLIWWTESIPIVSDPDPFNLLGIPVGPLLGPFLNLLPFFAVGLMIAQQKLMTPPAMDEQQAMQQKMMKYMMIFFGILFYKVASGLCIYFITSSLWGLAERKMLPKRKTSDSSAVAQSIPPPSKGKGPGGKGYGKGPGGKGPGGKGAGPKDDKPNGTIKKVKDWWEDVLKKASKK